MHRYEKLRNRSLKYRFSTGTDEHGTKVQQAAALHNQAPGVYCDQISQKYRHLFDTANIEYTHYNRTTDKTRHLQAVQHFWVRFISDIVHLTLIQRSIIVEILVFRRHWLIKNIFTNQNMLAGIVYPMRLFLPKPS